MGDSLNSFLIQLKNQDEQPTNTEIGRLFGVDESTVRRRKRKLEKSAQNGQGTYNAQNGQGMYNAQNGHNPNREHITRGDVLEQALEDSSMVQVSGSPGQIDFNNLQTKNPLDPTTPASGGAFAKIFELAGLNPEKYELVKDTFKFSTWQQSKATEDGGRDLIQLYSYRGSFRRTTALDLEAEESARLLLLARSQSHLSSNSPNTASTNPNNTNKYADHASNNKYADHASNNKYADHASNNKYARIVIAGDYQAGKVDRLGGTKELLERVERLNQKLAEVMHNNPCAEAYVFDPGDLTEGFENTSSQQFTNDLSLPGMLRIGRTILTGLVGTVLSQSDKVTVVTVPSNHGAWRKGKGVLGKPSDDFGLEVHDAVRQVFEVAELPVTWIVPEEWDESVAVQVGNTRVGLVHGHQARSKRFVEWWKGQALGSGPVADCHICISGHYHSLLLETAGFLDGRERYHIQSPPMDNGSSWWRNLTGEESTPGMVTFLLEKESGRILHFEALV